MATFKINATICVKDVKTPLDAIYTLENALDEYHSFTGKEIVAISSKVVGNRIKDIKKHHANLRRELIRYINEPKGKKTVILSTGETAIDFDDAWLVIGRKGSPFLRDKREQWMMDDDPNYRPSQDGSGSILSNWDTDELMETAIQIAKKR